MKVQVTVLPQKEAPSSSCEVIWPSVKTIRTKRKMPFSTDNFQPDFSYFFLFLKAEILKLDFCAPSKSYLLTTLQRKMANKSVNLLIKWVNMNKKCKKLSKSWIFQLAYKNLKMLRKVSKFWKLNEFSLFGLILNTGSCLK